MNRFMMENRPRLLLVYADSAHASLAGRYFRRLGWEVRMVAGGAEARRQFAEFQPTFVVVDTDLADESGWLTCAKIMLDRPCARIIIQAPVRNEESLRLMAFVRLDGLITRDEGVEGLAEILMGQVLAQSV